MFYFTTTSFDDALKTAHQVQQAQNTMMADAATVIQVRCAQMMFGTMTITEATRMVAEKPVAFVRSAEMMIQSLLNNQGAGEMALAAIGPIGAEAQANAQRLSQPL